MTRRDILIGGSAILASSLTGCSDKKEFKEVSINRAKKVTLKLATSWPAHFPILGGAADFFSQRVNEVSGGSLEVKIYPKNTLVPALEVFDAVSAGAIDIFHSGPYYWKGKNSALSLIGGIPFGFTANEMNAWMMFEGGLELWGEIYKKYNLYPMLGGNVDSQMGGWFRKEINSLSDLNGLKMRIPGLAGEVVSRLGVNPVLLPAGDIFLSLERGVIDATEWVGPALDIKMGFYKVAKHYYSGWHEPGSIIEFSMNLKKFKSLSNEHKAIISSVSNEANSRMIYESQSKNAYALLELAKLGIKPKPFPNDVIEGAKKALYEVIEIEAGKNEDFKRVWESMENFLTISKEWTNMGLKSFLDMRG